VSTDGLSLGVLPGETVDDVTPSFDSFRDAPSRTDEGATADVTATYDRSEITYCPTTTDRNTVFCATLNYAAHAEESDSAVPERPLVFTKLPWTLVNAVEAVPE